MTMFHSYPFTTMFVTPLNAVLLSPCFPILLNVDVVIGLEGMDGLVGEFDTMGSSAITRAVLELRTYVKPLIKVNSCLMVPPCDLALSLALKSIS